MTPYKLYTEWTAWWLLVLSPESCAEEAAGFRQLLREVLPPQSQAQAQRRTLVEFGCGGGGNASHLKADFAMTLVDLSPQMLAVSRGINPECEHILGDMRSVRLGRQFDVVFIHDAIMYMTTESDLRQALETAYLHCKLGGVALFYPDCVRENFQASSTLNGGDGAEYALRYMDWTFDPDPTDTHYTVHFAFLLCQGNAVQLLHEQHTFGLFAQADWMRLLREVGFQPEVRGNVFFLAHTNP